MPLEPTDSWCVEEHELTCLVTPAPWLGYVQHHKVRTGCQVVCCQSRCLRQCVQQPSAVHDGTNQRNRCHDDDADGKAPVEPALRSMQHKAQQEQWCAKHMDPCEQLEPSFAHAVQRAHTHEQQDNTQHDASEACSCSK